ncbi:uncharacterized protein MELLADRAFT_49481 [Melampsora larici-populina 98AG31]|uniref:Vacuolar transporter chaperone complex subunit 4 n=1 Tax=Melampsora larici-populina (strain 98AG31 / pathotype 3-4-7) TaxID=747676 RepID=F4RVI8_MELLP|nr:uncharacterized protein MELLADRAFT_49481 [Melampsora larici-populina 98AG31]EGG03659.1 hypothetical protein MELLADRAFT_49481 [Melampsora larici-populina 98AG31]
MKFGVTIKRALNEEWSNYYVDYSGLKKFIKHRQSKQQWDDTDEQAFVSELDKELQKVADFQERKILDLHESITFYEIEVKNLISNTPGTRNPDDSSKSSATRAGDDADEEAIISHTSDGEPDEDTEERYAALEEELTNIIADVHDLGHFSHLNYTAFIKIVKKHDKKTGWELRRDFIQHHLETRPFYKENYEALVVQLSRLFNLVRTRGNPPVGDSAAGGGQSAFVRQTTKYWVHRSNFVALKLLVLKHLPVLVFNPEKAFEPSDSAISSIYYDNEDLELYLGRLEKTEGAEAIRMRWYGDMSVSQIFVERKTHREDWTGEKSVKARFSIKEDKLNDYLNGKIQMDEQFEAIRKKGKKSDKEIDSMIRLAREVQDRIKQKDLQPCVRTFYNRTAFQQPGDARVRISFDTDLTLIREDNWDGKIRRPDNNWRRKDVGIDFPFDNVDSDDKHLFPYGVLEVKLQTQLGQEPPEWVKDLVSGPLVEAVPKFSKFIHGCATLMPDRVCLVPFWLPQMEIDILKADPSLKVIDRGQGSNSPPKPSSDNASGRIPVKASKQGDKAGKSNAYTEPLSEDEDGAESGEERLQQIANHTEESRWAGLPPDAVAEAKAAREKNRSSDPQPSSHAIPPIGATKPSPSEAVDTISMDAETGSHQISSLVEPAYLAKLTPGNLRKMLKVKAKKLRSRNAVESGSQENHADASDAESDLADEGPKVVGATAPRESGVEWIRHFQAPRGKRVAVPVRVEPKVYFATERTFLTWLEFSTLLGAIAVTLMSFTAVDDHVGFTASITFTVVALLSIIYSTGTYVWRVMSIRQRSASGYHDPYGPTALCGILFLAVFINFYLRLDQ